MNIIEFAQHIGYPLHPVQAVILKLMYQLPLSHEAQEFRVELGHEPGGMSEASYARLLLKEERSNHDCLKGPARRLLWVGGRRGGRSYVLTLVLLYETWKILQEPCPQERYGWPATTPLCGMVVGSTGSDVMLAQERLWVPMSETPFRERRANEQQAARYFQTDRDIEDTGPWEGSQRQARATIRVRLRTRTAKGLRGNASYCVLLDDLTEFPDASWKDTLKALEPSTVVTRGKVLVSSIGGEKDSKVWKLYEQWVGDSETLCVQTPTWEAQPNIPLSEFARYEKLYDSALFRTEFGAELLEKAETPVTRNVYRQLVDAAENRGQSVESLVENILTNWLLSNGERGRN